MTAGRSSLMRDDDDLLTATFADWVDHQDLTFADPALDDPSNHGAASELQSQPVPGDHFRRADATLPPDAGAHRLYESWRQDHLAGLDARYRAWRAERAAYLDAEYARWRGREGGPFDGFSRWLAARRAAGEP